MQRLDDDRSGSLKEDPGLKVKSSPKEKSWVSAFDGDESALHAPQSEDARREVAGLMSVACNIMNAQTNNNIAGVVFDALTASYILSLPETRIERETFYNILLFTENRGSIATLNDRLDRYDVPRYSGRALLSAIFPEDFFYTKDATVIKDGILISGVLDSSNIGSASGSIIQALYKDYGQQRTVDFLTDIYHIAGAYMDTHGFSVGMDDCFLKGEAPQETINYEVQRALMLVRSMGSKLLDPLEEERREKQIRAYLDTAKNFGTKISKENLSPDNSFNVMAKSGAKGSTVNIAQITGILGQQFLSGQRMPESISGKTRSLPYFPENDLDPAARGFVTNSFLTGLTPAEYFFTVTASRTGLVDSAIKSLTGESPINVCHNGKPKRVLIGEWIDKMMKENEKDVQHYKERDMELLWTQNEDLWIPTVDSKGNMSWGKIDAITRHDPGLELYEIKTLSGREVIVTESKSLLIWDGKEFNDKLTPEVKLGDCVPTAFKLGNIEKELKFIDFDSERFHLNEESGLIVGSYLAEPFEVPSFLENFLTNLPPESFIAPDEFVKALLSGYISKKGVVNETNIQIFGNPILLEGFITLLARFGIFTFIHTDYLEINGEWLAKFIEAIPLNGLNLSDIRIMPSAVQSVCDTVLDPIVYIGKVDVSLHPKVYDLTIPSTLNFTVASLISLRDTADTGHASHKIIKSMEDIRVVTDGSVRNAFDIVFEFSYGEDGFNAAQVETVKTKTGTFTSFINIKRAAQKINGKYGFK